MKVNVVSKVVKDGVIVGVIAKPLNSSGTLFIQKSMFKNYAYENVKITSDNKIIGNIPVKDYNTVFSSKVTLYHGTSSPLKGKISPNYTRGSSDFGRGFYTGEFEMQAASWVCDCSHPLVYTLSADLSGLKVFNFLDKDDLWALYIAVNRGVSGIEKTEKLKKVIKYIDSHDVIIGLIADDKLFPVFSRFVVGAITSKALIESLRYVKLGNQYMFKTEKACSRIKIVNKKELSPREKRIANTEVGSRLQGIEGVVSSMSGRYRRVGKFIDELMEEYK